MERDEMVTLEAKVRERTEVGVVRVGIKDKEAWGETPLRVKPVWLASRIRVEESWMGPLMFTSFDEDFRAESRPSGVDTSVAPEAPQQRDAARARSNEGKVGIAIFGVGKAL
jgi:hypothetical protein